MNAASSTVVPLVHELLREDPALGGSAAATRLTASLQQLEQGATEFRRAVTGSETHIAVGAGRVTAVLGHGLSTELRPEAARLVASATQSAQAMAVYAEELERICVLADKVRLDAEDGLALVRVHAVKIAELAAVAGVAAGYEWRTGPPATMPPEGSASTGSVEMFAGNAFVRSQLLAGCEAAWWWAAAQWRRGSDVCIAAETHWADLLRERRQAEQQLVTSLNATPLGQLFVLAVRQGGFAAASIAGLGTGAVGLGRGLGGSGSLGGGGDDSFSPRHPRTSHPLLNRLIGDQNGRGIWDDPPDPDRVAAAWNKLSAAEQRRLIEQVPWVIGNLAGLPYSVRDQANHRQLEEAVRGFSTLSPDSKTALTEVIALLAEDEGSPPMMLVALDLTGKVPKGAIGYGDLDRAEHLSWQVPGMFNDMHEGIVGWDRSSKHLMRAQKNLIGSGHPTGAIVFFEYDTPNAVTVLSSETARVAAPRLAAELDGSHALRLAAGATPNTSVIAHSYGTPVAAEALTLTKHPVLAYTMLGSAGLDRDTVTSLADLHVARDTTGTPQVFTTIAAKDRLAPFGSNLSERMQPNSSAAWSSERVVLGALSFSSDGLGDDLATNGHSIIREDGQGYLDIDTQALKNVAALSLGRTQDVLGGLSPVTPRNPTLWEGRENSMPLGGRR